MVLNQRFYKYLLLPGDSPEDLETKKNFLLLVAPSVPTLLLFGLIFWIIGKHHLSIAFWIFSLFSLSLTLLFLLFRKHLKQFVLINQYFYVLFSFLATLYFGGILHSGGVVFVGLAGALLSLPFLSTKQIKYIFIVYIGTIVVEAFLQPYLIPHPEFTSRTNLILFVLHLLTVSYVLLVTLNNYLKQSIMAKKAEADHLKELDDIKTKFYTNITHEFRTPLTVILGLTNPSINLSQDKLKMNMSMIRRNGTRLLQLVNQMLDLSKLQANSMQVTYVQSNIIPFLHNVIEPFRNLANKKNVDFRFLNELDELTMDFDPEKMESILSNLLSNALKFTPEGGSINMSLSILSNKNTTINYGYSPLPEFEFKSAQILSIQVKDDGPGIESEELSKVFERFYQVQTSTLNPHEGSGIGLLLVKELVNLLSGKLFISSSPGKGTEISVLLPISRKAAYSDYSELALQENSIGEHQTNFPISAQGVSKTKELPLLLIVEDNDDVANYIEIVTEKNYQTIRAENGIRGVEMALDHVPDIIISDVLMPGKNGFEVCATLKKDFRTSHIPIVLLTAKTDKESQITGYEQGADAYIAKPFEPRELLIRLQKLIEIRETLKAKYKTLALVSDLNENDVKDPEEQFLLKTQNILLKYHSEDNFNSEELSKRLGVSRTQLFRKLKALTGLSASHFINFYRLSIAKQKIQKTALTISEIAYDAGFKDPAYFSRLFKKEFGTSPMNFRIGISDSKID